MSDPKFLSLKQVLEIHRIQLQCFGGREGIRDQAALESAVAMPRAGLGDKYFHLYPFGMAAAYAFHIAENQPFIDGNKRTALDSALTFLEANGVPIEDADMRLYQAMFDIADRRLSKAGLEALLKDLAG